MYETARGLAHAPSLLARVGMPYTIDCRTKVDIAGSWRTAVGDVLTNERLHPSWDWRSDVTMQVLLPREKILKRINKVRVLAGGGSCCLRVVAARC